GHGLMDLVGYEKYFRGMLEDYPLPEEMMQQSLKAIENLPKPKLVRSGKW
ncbi:MAG: hypothetical protein HY718_05060, partial [Planctomycetes bacterium]|nr:hypothetical protein [Planctomycetota bacterium]